jgi:hypothetical protein
MFDDDTVASKSSLVTAATVATTAVNPKIGSLASAKALVAKEMEKDEALARKLLNMNDNSNSSVASRNISATTADDISEEFNAIQIKQKTYYTSLSATRYAPYNQPVAAAHLNTKEHKSDGDSDSESESRYRSNTANKIPAYGNHDSSSSKSSTKYSNAPVAHADATANANSSSAAPAKKKKVTVARSPKFSKMSWERKAQDGDAGDTRQNENLRLKSFRRPLEGGIAAKAVAGNGGYKAKDDVDTYSAVANVNTNVRVVGGLDKPTASFANKGRSLSAPRALK